MSDNRDAAGRIVTRDEKGTTTMTPEIADQVPANPPLENDWGYQETKTIDDYEKEEAMLARVEPLDKTRDQVRLPPAPDIRRLLLDRTRDVAVMIADELELLIDDLALYDPALATRHAPLEGAVDALIEDLEKRQRTQ